jgi:hypothetical protein
MVQNAWLSVLLDMEQFILISSCVRSHQLGFCVPWQPITEAMLMSFFMEIGDSSSHKRAIRPYPKVTWNTFHISKKLFLETDFNILDSLRMGFPTQHFVLVSCFPLTCNASLNNGDYVVIQERKTWNTNATEVKEVSLVCIYLCV